MDSANYGVDAVQVSCPLHVLFKVCDEGPVIFHLQGRKAHFIKLPPPSDPIFLIIQLQLNQNGSGV